MVKKNAKREQTYSPTESQKALSYLYYTLMIL